MAAKQLSDGGPDGLSVGQSSTDKLGFYGLATNIVRQSAPAAATNTTTATSTTTALTTDLDALRVEVNALRTILVNLNLCA